MVAVHAEMERVLLAVPEARRRCSRRREDLVLALFRRCVGNAVSVQGRERSQRAGTHSMTAIKKSGSGGSDLRNFVTGL